MDVEELRERFTSVSDRESYIVIRAVDMGANVYYNSIDGSHYEKDGLFNISFINAGAIRHLEDHFVDPLNPTQEENVLFMLEHDLDYKELIQQAKIKKN